MKFAALVLLVTLVSCNADVLDLVGGREKVLQLKEKYAKPFLDQYGVNLNGLIEDLTNFTTNKKDDAFVRKLMEMPEFNSLKNAVITTIENFSSKFQIMDAMQLALKVSQIPEFTEFLKVFEKNVPKEYFEPVNEAIEQYSKLALLLLSLKGHEEL